MNIELIPAIDIIGGRCVRLQQGDYERRTTYEADALDLARSLEAVGVERLHMVDLDGAREGHVVNLDLLRRVATGTGLRIDFGGGVKCEEDLRAVLDAGASMVTVSSLAVKKPEVFGRWIEVYGAEHFILAADVRNGKIPTDGWLRESDVTLMDFIRYYYRMGIRRVLCTDIERDGMMGGPATELYREILRVFPDLHLIASGGVRDVNDLRALDEAGVPAVVFGKALLEGHIKIEDLCLRNE